MRTKPKLILGGPGCGKTTALLNIIEDAFSRGISPERIAFVAFTRKAAKEARDRMVAKFGIEEDAMPHFRTLHSFAFRHIEAQDLGVLTKEKLLEWAKAEALTIRAGLIDEFGQVIREPSTPDENALSALSLARLTRSDLEDVTHDFSLPHEYVLEVKSAYDYFKQEHFLLDFTDAIERFVDEGDMPPLDILIVDEAQDLSRLQWEMVRKMGRNVPEIYYAGDDDQAIFAWAGADTEYFLNMDADREVLPISYRLKSNIFDACQKVIRLVDDRYEKDWKPHAEGGEVEYIDKLANLPLHEGEWMILARTNSLVQRITKHLRFEGFPYYAMSNDGMKSSLDSPVIRAALIYENLKQGRTYLGEDMRLLWRQLRSSVKPDAAPVFDSLTEHSLSDLCSTGLDSSPSWFDMLHMSQQMDAYVRAMRARGESLSKPPRITASTIHGVKGGEADNVVVWQRLTSQTYASLLRDDPVEYRALFTAMSRAKQRLIFLDSSNRMNYHVGRMLL